MLTETLRVAEHAAVSFPGSPFPGSRAADRAVPIADSMYRSLTRTLAEHAAGEGALDALVERLPLAIVMTDRQGNTVYANAAGRALPLMELPDLELAVGQALMTGEAAHAERVACRAAGQAPRWLNVDIAPVRGTSGLVAATLLVIADDTTRTQVAEWRPIIDTLLRL